MHGCMYVCGRSGVKRTTQLYYTNPTFFALSHAQLRTEKENKSESTVNMPGVKARTYTWCGNKEVYTG